MSTDISVQIIPQGLLIPLAAINEWLEEGDLEVIKEEQRIIIQPKPTPPLTERGQVLQILEKAGLIIPPEPLPSGHKPVSPEEQVELARKFSVGHPLSELIMEEREVDNKAKSHSSDMLALVISVYQGLSPEEIDEIEQIVLDRSRSFSELL